MHLPTCEADMLSLSGAYNGRCAMQVAAEEARHAAPGKQPAAVLDCHKLFCGQPHWRGLRSDGLHLKARGSALLFGAIRDVILHEMPEIVPETLPLDLPLHDDFVDGCDAAAVLQAWLR